MAVDLVVLENLPEGATRQLVADVKKTKAHPFWPDTSTAVSSHTSLYSSSTQRRAAAMAKASLKALLACDRISFVSGSSMVSAEAAHVLNAMRPKPSLSAVEREKFDRLLSAVEERLNLQSFCLRSTFTLDGLPNRILLKVDEHRAWGTYGAFALTPNILTLFTIQQVLMHVNKRWDEDKSPTREFFENEIDELTKSIKWVVLLLRPWRFLPPNELLWMAFSRQITSPSQQKLLVHTNPDMPHYPYLIADFDMPQMTGHEVYTLRSQEDELSLFAMILNAYAKVRAAVKRGNTHEDVAKYYRALETTLELIMYRPHPSSPGDSMNVDETPQPSPETRAPFRRQSAHGDTAPNAPSLAVAPHGSSPGPAFGPRAEPPEPVLHNNLTGTEMQTLLQRSGDSRLSSLDRVEAMMQLLCPPVYYDDPHDDSGDDVHDYSEGDDGREYEDESDD